MSSQQYAMYTHDFLSPTHTFTPLPKSFSNILASYDPLQTSQFTTFISNHLQCKFIPLNQTPKNNFINFIQLGIEP